MDKIGAVILAAGASSRLGEPKQLLVWKGKPLVARAAESVIAAGVSEVVVVVGAHADLVRAALAEMPVRIVENAAWREGMSSSVRAGIGALGETGMVAAMIVLCDQPFFSEQAAARLIMEWTRFGGIVAARYDGRLGAPVIFGKEYFDALLALRGDEGARRILIANMESVTGVDLPELAADVDTPDDWKRVRTK